MAETTVPHWTIGAALALFGTALAAEPMGEATHNVGTVCLLYTSPSPRDS